MAFDFAVVEMRSLPDSTDFQISFNLIEMTIGQNSKGKKSGIINLLNKIGLYPKDWQNEE
jgi:hypothetical protein